MNNFKVIGAWFINFIRSLVRPVVTIGLVLFAVYLGVMIVMMVQAAQAAGQITAEQLLTLVQMVLQFLFTITASVIAFWFGERKQKIESGETTNGQTTTGSSPGG